MSTMESRLIVRASTLTDEHEETFVSRRERPASSPVGRIDSEDFLLVTKTDVLVVHDSEDDPDESDDEEEEEEEEEGEEERNHGTPDSESKLLPPQSKPSAPSQPSASSTQSATSSRSLALPPLTSHQLTRSRYILGAPTFFDSFFGVEELDRYFPDRKLRMSIITWNMSSKAPDNYNQVLQDMLIPPLEMTAENSLEEDAEQTLPELYIIGLQETPKSEVTVANIKVGIQAVLGPNYALLQWSAMGVLHASMWMRRELLWSCTSVDSATIHYRPTAANRIKTKGALALSFSLFGTSFLFINTHLSAHETNLRTRINQLDKVHQVLNLKSRRRSSRPSGNPNVSKNGQLTGSTKVTKGAPLTVVSQRNPSGISRNNSRRHSRNRHSECLFWLGDLNFRLELPMESVLDSIRSIVKAPTDEARLELQKTLMRSDQLTNLMARDMAFEGFREAIWPPPFLPTYKWKIKSKFPNPSTKHVSNSESNSSASPTPSLGSSASLSTNHSSSNSRSVPVNLNNLTSSTSNLEANAAQYANATAEDATREYNTARVPSFTDRILYQSRLANGDIDSTDRVIKCVRYLSLESITSSDHKPVYSLFEVSLDSGGPRVPFRLKKLGQMVDGIKTKLLSKENSLEESHGQQHNSSHGLGRNISFFSRKLGRNRTKAKANGMHAAGGSQGLQSLSLSSLQPSSSALGRLDKLSRLNAGAFERQVFIDGLRLRNSLLQNTTLDEFKQKHHFALFKSRSLDSNIPEQNINLDTITAVAASPVPLKRSTLDRRTMSQLEQSNQANGNHPNGATHHRSQPDAKQPSNSSICVVM